MWSMNFLLDIFVIHSSPHSSPSVSYFNFLNLSPETSFLQKEKEEKCNNKIVDFKKLSKDEVRRVVKLNINRLIPPTNSFSLRLIIGYLPLIGYNYIFIINVEI